MGLGIDISTDGNKSKYRHITEAERYKIEGYKKINMSHRKIAKILKDGLNIAVMDYRKLKCYIHPFFSFHYL